MSAPTTLVFVDPDTDERDRADEWEESLGATIVTLAPDEFGLHMLDEVEDAGAFVVAWDLGAQCGLHLVEALRADERTRAVPLVLAAAQPTRGMVVAALRAGATSFACKPYDPEELGRRLGRADAAAGDEPEPGGDDPAEPGTGDEAAGED